jgi:hypothetical protein
MKAGGLHGLAKSLSLFPLARIALLMSGILNRRSCAMEKEVRLLSPSSTYV